MNLNAVPQATQTLAATQAPILDNFTVIDTAFSVNHADYNTPNQGFHNLVTFPVQDPAPTPGTGQVLLYSQESALTDQPELVFARQEGSTAPMAVQVTEFTSAGWGNPGWTKLPSGILMKWHQGIPTNFGTPVPINLNTDVPGSPDYTQLFSVSITTQDTARSYSSNIGIATIDYDAATFTVSPFYTVNVPGPTVSFGYLAIGM